MSPFERTFWVRVCSRLTSSFFLFFFPYHVLCCCCVKRTRSRARKSILSSQRVLFPYTWAATVVWGGRGSPPTNEINHQFGRTSRLGVKTKKKKRGSCMHDEWAPTMSWCRVCIIYVTQVEFLRSQLVRARIKVSVAAETLQQHCATYNEYDPFLNPPQPSNPWLSDDPTYWILNAPAWVTILLFDFFLSFRKQKLACQLSYFWSLGGLTASCSWEEDTKGLVKHKFLLGDTKS